MRVVPKWDAYFMALAHVVASRSKDPEIQVGAVLTLNRLVLGTGYNGFPSGMHEDAERWMSPVKFDYVVHAEMNAISGAARKGIHIFKSTLYSTMIPCPTCCKLLMTMGVREIVYDSVTTAKYMDICNTHYLLAKTIVIESGGCIREIRD